MYDAHLHLQDPRFDKNRPEIISDMVRAGIKQCVVNGTSPSDWQQVADLAAQYPEFIIPSFGLHPWQTATHDWKKLLLKYIDNTAHACVGECGLDRWIKDYNIEQQVDVFKYQIELAADRNLPLSIHCLKAWGPLLDVLKSVNLPKRGFLLHSYSGSKELIPILAELGAYFSFSGYFLHPRKLSVLDNFRHIPPERLLIETDAPDMLPPKSLRKKPDSIDNHPVNLIEIKKSLSIEVDCSFIDSNFQTFFY